MSRFLICTEHSWKKCQTSINRLLQHQAKTNVKSNVQYTHADNLHELTQQLQSLSTDMLHSSTIARTPCNIILKNGKRLTVSWGQHQSQRLGSLVDHSDQCVSLQKEQAKMSLMPFNHWGSTEAQQFVCEQEDLYKEVERLSLANLREFLKVRNRSVDIETAYQQYVSRTLTRNPYCPNSDRIMLSEPVSMSHLSNLDGKGLDRYFGLDSHDAGTEKNSARETPSTSTKQQATSENEYGHEKYTLTTKDITHLLQMTFADLKSMYSVATATSEKLGLNESREPYAPPKPVVLDAQSILLCNSQDKSKQSASNKPTLAQLQDMQDHLSSAYIPKFYTDVKWELHVPDIVFENNFNPAKPYTKVGLQKYIWAVIKLRFWVGFRYTWCNVKVTGSWINEDNGSLRMHWKHQGLTQGKTLKIWKFWNRSKRGEQLEKEAEIIEGISTFYLNGNGLITKHVIDRISMDPETAKKDPVLVKLAKRVIPAPT